MIFALPVLAIGVFLIERWVFHYPAIVGVDAIVLAALITVPGFLLLTAIRRNTSFTVHPHLSIVLSCAMGFCILPILESLLHALSLAPPLLSLILRSFTILAAFWAFIEYRRASHFKISEAHRSTLRDLFACLLFVLILLAVYNLPQLHFAGDGSIMTKGLFGVDIPFLAGEVDGIRSFGELRDLHQYAQPWHYHDATYQLLALLPRDHTLADVAFVAPLVGYTMLAFAVLTTVLHLTDDRKLAYASVAGWFLLNGLGGNEFSSYALSPSFVFGTMLVLGVVLLLSHRELQTRHRWLLTTMLLWLLISLSQTKLSTYLVLTAGLGMLALYLFWRNWRSGTHLLLAASISFAIVLVQSSRPNPYMPGNDFVIGAPLLGYANHIAAVLHVPVSQVNPVSHGLQFHLQSLLLIPFGVFHLVRIAMMDPKIVLAVAVSLFGLRAVWNNKGEHRDLLLLLCLLVPIGILLPVLYSPAWYPLALSFYAPLVSSQAAFLVAILLLPSILGPSFPRGRRIVLISIGGVAIIAGLGITVRGMMRDISAPRTVVQPTLVSAMEWFAASTPDTAVIATHQYNLHGPSDSTGDESFYWYSALSHHPVVSEGAKYGSLLAAFADVDTAKGLHRVPAAAQLLAARRAALDTIYESQDSGRVIAALHEMHVSYILEDSIPDRGLSLRPHSREVGGNDIALWRAEKVATIAYQNSKVLIWKVRE